MQINRLFEIITILLNKGSVKAKELAEHFEVSTRTIYRDVETLGMSGVPIYTTKGSGGGIALMQEYTLNKALLSEKERKDILFALQSLKAVNYPDVSVVLDKINALFRSADDDSWIEVDFIPWGSGMETKRKFTALKNAILSRNVVTFDYYNSYGTMTSRRVEPLKLSFKGQAWYLQAFSLEKQAMRLFRLSRIKRLSVTGEYFIKRTELYIETDSEREPPKEDIRMRIRFSPEIAYRVFDDFGERYITEAEDGRMEVDVTYPPGEWVFGYIMSFGSYAEVIEPEFLREQIKSRINEMADIYS